MNKKAIWIVVIVAVIIIVGLFVIFKDDNEEENQGGIIIVNENSSDNTEQDAPADNLNSANLDTSDDVFNQLDDAVEYAD